MKKNAVNPAFTHQQQPKNETHRALRAQQHLFPRSRVKHLRPIILDSRDESFDVYKLRVESNEKYGHKENNVHDSWKACHRYGCRVGYEGETWSRQFEILDRDAGGFGHVPGNREYGEPGDEGGARVERAEEHGVFEAVVVVFVVGTRGRERSGRIQASVQKSVIFDYEISFFGTFFFDRLTVTKFKI